MHFKLYLLFFIMAAAGVIEVKGYAEVSEGDPQVRDMRDHKFRTLCNKTLPVVPLNNPHDPQLKDLVCVYYDNGKRPFLRIAPVKMEYNLYNPTIITFHEVVYDSEIEAIIKMGQSRMKEASTIDPVKGTTQVSDYRKSNVAWIFHHELDKLQRLLKRIEEITGLNTHWSEALQIAAYPPGGFFRPHYDRLYKLQTAYKDEMQHVFGDRIATWLNYMNDVEDGGETVFTSVNIRVFPKKGNAILWFNLLKNGEGDDYTEHAGCPVRTGIKWISTVWVRENGQEFRRPCSLNPGE